MYNLKQTARMLGRSVRWTSERVRRGHITGVMVGRQRLFDEAEVERFRRVMGLATPQDRLEPLVERLTNTLEANATQMAAAGTRMDALERRVALMAKECGSTYRRLERLDGLLDLLDLVEQRDEQGMDISATTGRLDELTREVAYLTHRIGPMDHLLGVSQLAKEHGVSWRDLWRALREAQVPMLVPQHADHEEPLLRSRDHALVVAALSAAGVPYGTCETCRAERDETPAR